jgi:hypothetical protein
MTRNAPVLSKVEDAAMKLTLTRQFTIDDATIGILAIDGKFQCFTLEDVVRSEKIKGKTAIPAGSYSVAICESSRFSDKYEEKGLGREVPLLMDVPNYKGVRIHVGNNAAHTDGCILVGSWRKGLGPRIEASAAAYRALMKVLRASDTKIRITIVAQIMKVEDGLRHPPRPLFDGLYSPGAAFIV